jgi:hypothetical protein
MRSGDTGTALACAQNNSANGVLPRAPRRKVFQPASIRVGGDLYRCHLLDVSASGARLHCTAPISAGASISVLVSQLVLTGKVVWTRAGRVGIAFAVPLVDRQIERIVLAV